MHPGGWNKTIPSSRHIHQLSSVVVADDERIEAMRARKITADDELLPTIHTVLYPRAGPSARFVQTIPSLADDAFEFLLGQHPVVDRYRFGWSLETIETRQRSSRLCHEVFPRPLGMRALRQRPVVTRPSACRSFDLRKGDCVAGLLGQSQVVCD